MIGRSKYEQYVVPPLTVAILACDVCGEPSRPLFYVPTVRRFQCSSCVVPLPA